MDIFTTLLSLADVTPPLDRRYDGIDATNILLHGEQNGRKVLFSLSFFLWFVPIHVSVSTAFALNHLMTVLLVSLPP